MAFHTHYIHTLENNGYSLLGFINVYYIKQGFPGGTMVKNLSPNAGDARDAGSVLGSGRSPGAGNGNSLQYSCLKNSMDRGT